MTDQPLGDREDSEPEAEEDPMADQEGKGYGADEGEREQSLSDE
jgi:hypothetical protein